MIINEIDTKDISFVVQGDIQEHITEQCLKSIRENFPGSTIILSTWENSKVDGLQYDKLVYSKDPGSAIYSLDQVRNNMNRQIVSTITGLQEVSTVYAAKVRSDLVFEGPNFLQYFNKFTQYDKQYCKVKSRIIIPTLYTRIFHAGENIVLANFHPSDWFAFGFTEDIRKLFSSNDLLSDIQSFSNYYITRPDERSYLPYPLMMAQVSPEQYFGAVFFNVDPNKITYKDLAEFDLKESIKYMVNNFVVLDYEYSRIYSAKWVERSRGEWRMNTLDCVGLLFFGDFLKYYKRYCDNSFKVPGDIDKVTYKRKIKIAWNCLITDKAKTLIRKFVKIWTARLRPMKRIMRIVLPGYRVGVGIRERLLAFEQLEGDRFNYLIYRIELLDKAQKKNLKEIRMLKERIAHLEDKELGVHPND